MKKFLLALLVVTPVFSQENWGEAFNRGLQQGTINRRMRESVRAQERQNQLYQEQINQQKAMMALEQVNDEIKSNSEDANLFVQRGNIWKYQLKDWAAASYDFTKAIKLDKGNATAWKELCLLHYETQMYDSAKNSCLEAVTYDQGCKKCASYYAGAIKKANKTSTK